MVNICFVVVCVSLFARLSAPRQLQLTMHGELFRMVLKARDELSRLVKIVRVRSRVLKTKGTFPLASPDSYPGFKSDNALFHL